MGYGLERGKEENEISSLFKPFIILANRIYLQKDQRTDFDWFHSIGLLSVLVCQRKRRL